MSKHILTVEEYRAMKGVCCPVCESHQIAGDSIEIDAGLAFQDCWCEVCGSAWTDEYSLTGYYNLEVESG